MPQFQGGREVLHGLDVPQRWRDDVRRVRWWVFVVYVPLTLMMVGGFVGVLVDAATGLVDVQMLLITWTLAVPFTLSMVIAGWLNTRSRRRAPLVALADGAGLRFRGAHFPWVMLLVLAACSLGGGVVGAVVALQHPPVGAQWNWGLVYAGAFTFIGGWILARVLLGHVRPTELQVTAEGITYRRPYAAFRLLWEDVNADRLSAWAYTPLGATVVHRGDRWLTVYVPVLRIPARPSRWATRIDVGPEVRMTSTTAFELEVFVDTLACDPVVVAHAVAWYALNPEHRDELADGRAMVRVLEGRAVVELDE